MQALHFKLLNIYRKRFKYILSLCWLPKLNAPRRFNHFALLACPFISLVVPSDSPIDPVLTTSSLIIQTGGPCGFIPVVWPLCNPATALISWTQNNGYALSRFIALFVFSISKPANNAFENFPIFRPFFVANRRLLLFFHFPFAFHICMAKWEMHVVAGTRTRCSAERRGKPRGEDEKQDEDTFEQIQ